MSAPRSHQAAAHDAPPVQESTLLETSAVPGDFRTFDAARHLMAAGSELAPDSLLREHREVGFGRYLGERVADRRCPHTVAPFLGPSVYAAAEREGGSV